jgi:tetratricopeptide (TPR) repeat protein
MVAATEATRRRDDGVASSDDATHARGSELRPVPSSGPARGSSVGRYLVLDRVGEGGMATVYVAYDPELDRKVALKLVRDGGTEEGALRMLREARALARLSHPHVVPVYDVGEHEGGVYVAMELVDGHTLRAWLAEPRRVGEVLRVLVAAGRGLEAAHAAGVVHRDFKPDNVMIGKDGRVRVLDFGLAREGGPAGVRAAAGGALSMVVTHGEILGTPAYMAPEQHDGLPLDPRADQFAFCVTLHEALYGERPFGGDGFEALRGAIARREIRRPPGVRVPGRLARIVERGLAEEPQARHPSMTELLRQLEAVRRQPGRIVRLSALAAALVLSSGVTWAIVAQEPPAAVDEVEGLVRQARDAAAKVLFVYPPPDDPEQPTAYVRVRQLEALDARGAREAATALRQEFAATLRRVGDEYWEREGGSGFAMDYYAQALMFVPDDAHARARTTITPGELASLRDKAEGGGFSEAELDAGALLAALAQPDPEERTQAVARHRSRRPRGRALSTELQMEALALGSGGGAGEPRGGSRSVGASPEAAVGSAVDDEGNAVVAEPEDGEVMLDDAEEEAHREAEPDRDASDQDRTPARRDPAAARALVQSAIAALERRDHAEAERLLHRALEADPRSAEALGRLSDVAFDRGRYDEAARWARRAVGLAPKTAAHHMRLGDALFKVQRYTEARQAYAAAYQRGAKGAAGRLAQIDAKLGVTPP